MGEIVKIEKAIEDKYNPQFIMDNRPSDDADEITAWLESFGLKPHIAKRCSGNFYRACVASVFNGIELVYKPPLQVVK